MRRNLRITFLVGCVLTWLLLIGLRVQSHFHYDSLELKTGSRVFQFRSAAGRLEFWLYDPLRASPAAPLKNIQASVNDSSQGAAFYSRRGNHRIYAPQGILGFSWQRTPNTTSVCAPYWFPILLVTNLAAIAAAPEIEWTKRFSLRTLLFITTLDAVLLGAVNYVAS